MTRTVKEMERKGYLRKQTSAEDGRVTCISLTDAGRQLSQKYNTQFFQALGPLLDGLSEEDADCMTRTVKEMERKAASCVSSASLCSPSSAR